MLAQYLAEEYGHDDEDGRGRYLRDNMASRTPRSNMTYEYKGFLPSANGWRFQREIMEKLDAEGRIRFPANKAGAPATRDRPRFKRYLSNSKGTLFTNLWLDIPSGHSRSNELIDYLTPKPIAFLECIVTMASNEGDVVLDSFVGGGRRWWPNA